MKDLNFSIIQDIKELQILDGRQSFGYTYDEALMSLLIKYFTWKDSLYLLVEAGDEFAGFCSMDRDWHEDEYFFLREILVDNKFLRHQIGGMLMEKSITHARSHGARGIVTETAFDNMPMIHLCEKFGFIKWHNPQWKDGITFKLVF